MSGNKLFKLFNTINSFAITNKLLSYTLAKENHNTIINFGLYKFSSVVLTIIII